MKRTRMRRRAPLRVKTKLRRSARLVPTASMAATERQRVAVAGRRCIVCGTDRRIDAAHTLSGRATAEPTIHLLVRLSACRQGEDFVACSDQSDPVMEFSEALHVADLALRGQALQRSRHHCAKQRKSARV